MKISEFLYRELKMSINKGKIINLVRSRAFFLGAWVYRFPRTSRIMISAPVNLLVDKFIRDGIGKKVRGGGFKPW